MQRTHVQRHILTAQGHAETQAKAHACTHTDTQQCLPAGVPDPWTSLLSASCQARALPPHPALGSEQIPQLRKGASCPPHGAVSKAPQGPPPPWVGESVLLLALMDFWPGRGPKLTWAAKRSAHHSLPCWLHPATPRPKYPALWSELTVRPVARGQEGTTEVPTQPWLSEGPKTDTQSSAGWKSPGD